VHQTNGLSDYQTNRLMDRAVIDRLISRESSASPNLVGDQAAHPVCDHLGS